MGTSYCTEYFLTVPQYSMSTQYRYRYRYEYPVQVQVQVRYRYYTPYNAVITAGLGGVKSDMYVDMFETHARASPYAL